MLARYPKVDIVNRKPACSPLPRICFQEQEGATLSTEEEGLLPRGCTSAPVVPDQQLDFDQDLQFFRWPSEQPEAPQRNRQCRPENHMNVSPEEDFFIISRCLQLLQLSGYYYEGLSWQQASSKLRKCRVGTFLVRESENANFLFTLSVQTKRGPTSVRIAYKGGQFRLDSDDDLVPQMPVFDSVTDLIEYYVRVSKELPLRKSQNCCWLDLAGECRAPVELYQPLYKHVLSLKHICRLNIVKLLRAGSPLCSTLNCDDSTDLPSALRDYIKDYSYSQ